MSPYLRFDFNKQPLQFINPIVILQTDLIQEVPSIFEKVEQALTDGYYVAGFVSYEAAPAFDPAFKVAENPQLPLVWFAVCEKPTPINDSNMVTEDFQVSDWSLDTDYETYQNAINQVKYAIKTGFTYQVNFTSRLHATFDGNAQTFYHQLINNQQASYNAYLNTGKHQILSASPELFFHVKHNKITTKPMKGTARRGKFSAEDQRMIQQLSQSEKEQAENLMIVDLLRNDIGRIAKPSSVRVPKLFEIESYPTVHQMTSTIEAELEHNTTIFDWFQSLFPCGSITGAPKIQTMDYIAKLEQSPRDVYCGAIGYITPEREAIFNVPIRTVIVDTAKRKATYGVGSGITWDSTVNGEYEELFTKAALLTRKRPSFELLESIKLDNGEYPLLSYHVNRMSDSASYLGFAFSKVALQEQLEKFARSHAEGVYKVRVLLTKSGEWKVEGTHVKQMQEPVTCSIACTPVDKNNLFLYHKTTNRSAYTVHQNTAPANAFSVLLWNQDGELTEFTTGNLVVEIDGEYYTPPIDSGLLPGTFRKQLLENNTIKEKVLHKQDLATCDKIWFINSVRGWLQVDIALHPQDK